MVPKDDERRIPKTLPQLVYLARRRLGRLDFAACLDLGRHGKVLVEPTADLLLTPVSENAIGAARCDGGSFARRGEPRHRMTAGETRRL